MSGFEELYEYFVESDLLNDDLYFSGDPWVHFSKAITGFIQPLQRNRLDKDTMNTFIEYLKTTKVK